MIGSEKNIWVCSDTSKAQELKLQKELEGEEVKEDRWREEEKSNDIRKGSIIGAEVGSEVLPPSGSSHEEDERWCEGDKVVPLKKRRGSFERRVREEMMIMEKDKKMKTKMKSMTNKKCVLQNADYEQEGKETKNTSTKKIKRAVAPWLKTFAAPKKDESERLSSSLPQGEKILLHDNDEDDEEDEKKPLMVTTKKRMKLGMVKARSISSLLGQTNNAVVVVQNNKSSS
ncbi:hypothetical protein F0562_017201 [Nyssa sinensis]|uniref:Uncharacterized protein n=1 Tax=Nyssa sinensis TaxID=561372 RepID=A0A5J4ZIF0_9ASTE|nr:hypothetical protein F0562_017201 [Nyssa sinensis]